MINQNNRTNTTNNVILNSSIIDFNYETLQTVKMNNNICSNLSNLFSNVAYKNINKRNSNNMIINNDSNEETKMNNNQNYHDENMVKSEINTQISSGINMKIDDNKDKDNKDNSNDSKDNIDNRKLSIIKGTNKSRNLSLIPILLSSSLANTEQTIIENVHIFSVSTEPTESSNSLPKIQKENDNNNENEINIENEYDNNKNDSENANEIDNSNESENANENIFQSRNIISTINSSLSLSPSLSPISFLPLSPVLLLSLLPPNISTSGIIPVQDIPMENIPAENIPMENIPAENIPKENIPADDIPIENILDNRILASVSIGRRRQLTVENAVTYLQDIDVNITAWNNKIPPSYLPEFTPSRTCLRPLLWFEVNENDLLTVINEKKQHGFVVSHLLPSR